MRMKKAKPPQKASLHQQQQQQQADGGHSMLAHNCARREHQEDIAALTWPA
jgi:hypothetical protein